MAQTGQDIGATLKALKIVRGNPGDGNAVEPATASASQTTEPDMGSAPDWLSHDDHGVDWVDEAAADRRSMWIGVLFTLVTIGWIVGAGYLLTLKWQQSFNLLTAVEDLCSYSLPLILLAVLWLLLNRVGVIESRHLSNSARRLQQEAAGLDSVLALINARITDNNEQLRGQGNDLLAYGETAMVRMGDMIVQLRRERTELEQQRLALEQATQAAQQQMTLLLRDLPKAETQSRSMIAAMTDAGTSAAEQAVALEAKLTAITAVARDSERDVGGIARTLTAQIGQIETASAAAGERLNDVASTLGQHVDGQLEKTSTATDQLRKIISEQASALTALTEQARLQLHDAAHGAMQGLLESLGSLEGRLAALDEMAKSTGAVHRDQLQVLADALDENIRAVASLHERGTSQTSELAEQLDINSDRVNTLLARLETAQSRVIGMMDDAANVESRLTTTTETLGDRLPEMLASLDTQTVESVARLQAALPDFERAEALGSTLRDAIIAGQGGLSAQNEQLKTLHGQIDSGLDQVRAKMSGLHDDLAAISTATTELSGQTAPQLLDALIRVRETADQAAEKARRAIMAIIPEASAALAQQSGKALSAIVSTTVTEQIDALAYHADAAVLAAHKASERLMRQMITIADTTSAVEQRLQEGQAEREQHDSDSLSRRVAMLIESLNSTSIDVAKLLSNDVTDTAWAAYLKGDRGVFTRRAVRLLDTGEARSVQHHYNDDPEFREQVNRYIHDFEGMLRQVLATRDGALLSVTLLSSDMGKLYVALAQAIERLRS